VAGEAHFGHVLIEGSFLINSVPVGGRQAPTSFQQSKHELEMLVPDHLQATIKENKHMYAVMTITDNKKYF